MTFDEYRAVAIDGSARYYDYLNRNGKGIIEVKVSRIVFVSEEEADLYLGSKLSRTDYMQIKVKAHIYSPAEIILRRYDKRSNMLRVAWDHNSIRPFADSAPPDVSVISDLKFLVLRVQKWYEKISSPVYLPTKPPVLSPPMPSLADIPTMEQEAAFHGIFSSPLSYVWGAPGTGKTQFVLARAVLSYCMADQQVLITAPTNNAVEQTLRGVLAVLSEAKIPFDKVVRLGVPSQEFFNEYPMVCENRSAEEADKNLKLDLCRFKRAINYHDAVEWLEAAEEITTKCSSSIDHLHSIIEQGNLSLAALQAELKTKQASIAPVFSEIDVKTAHKKDLLSFVTKKRSRLVAWFLRKKLASAITELASLDSRLTVLSAQHQSILGRCNELEAQIASEKKTISASEKEIGFLKGKIASIPPCPNMPTASISEVRSIIAERSNEYAEISREYAGEMVAKISSRIAELDGLTVASRIANALVVASTVDGYIQKLANDNDFAPAHIFLDEAAYCPLVKGFTLLAKGVPIAFLGDHMQLPPVCEMPDKEFKNDKNMSVCLWSQSALYICDLFEKSLERIRFDYLHEELPSFSAMRKYDLLWTHRFGENLAYVLRRFVYPTDFQGNKDIPTELFYINVPKRLPTKDNTNPSEVSAIKAFLEYQHFDEVAVLTPFRNQRELLKKQIKAAGIKNADDIVFTIHGSQGREWDTVVLSVVISEVSGFLSRRLLNTAVSRAKKRLILVCNADFWKYKDSHIIGGLISASESLSM